METVRFSVIVPVYKVEKYLHQCVDSVINQTFKNIEIILVDDGSPDRCPQICDEYIRKDDRVVVIHKENGGLSNARNDGLKKARGEYVIFLDSDDYYLRDDFLEIINRELSDYSYDALFFQRRKYYEATQVFDNEPTPYSQSALNGVSADDILFDLSKYDKLDANASMKVLKREYLLQNALFFKAGIYSEDVEWFFNIAPGLCSIKLINTVGYCYRKREGSISNSISQKNIEDLFFSIEKYAEPLKEATLSDKKKKALLNYLAYQYSIVIGLIGNYLKGADKKEFLHRCKKYKWLVAYAMSQKAKKAAIVINLFGINIASFVLGKYIATK